MRAALIQLSSSDDPSENLPVIRAHLRSAANAGAQFVLTPEVTNCVATDRARQEAVLRTEAEDITLTRLCADAAELGLWLLIGSLALKTDDPEGRYANRSFLVRPDGVITARYDKIHMFDVEISRSETHRESARFRPGGRAVTAVTPFGCVGMTICYDLRFPQLYRALAQAGATILTVPAAFTPLTGAAHWECLLRARAIESQCFVLAPAQTGNHSLSAGRPRETYGHSLAVSPWGEVLANAGTREGVTIVDFDPEQVDDVRRRIPSLEHDRPFEGP